MARVIVHVDLDAFYAAVEQVRLGLPLEQPLAVQQWEGLIAVNYAARAKGVTRFMAIQDAKQNCPDLKLVHVEVIGGSSKREEGKVSLERYRQASSNILPIFHRFSPLCEKASIDEAYLDLTAQVEALLNQSPETAPVYNNPETADASARSQPISMATVQERPDVIVLEGPLNPSNEYDRRLLAGATIVAQMREAVFHELGYTCSAGIAPNKLLAKLASAMNKPYKQTVVTPRAIPGLMQDFPMRKIRNLGGKMGKELCDTLGCETAGDVQQIPEAVLIEKLGDKMGPWVYRAVRGIHDEPVMMRQISKSMLAAKSYSQTNSMNDIRHWLRLLSMELAARIEYDVKLNKRRPKTFHLYYRGFDSRRRLQDHSKSCPMPPHIVQLILQIHNGKIPKSPTKAGAGAVSPSGVILPFTTAAEGATHAMCSLDVDREASVSIVPLATNEYEVDEPVLEQALRGSEGKPFLEQPEGIEGDHAFALEEQDVAQKGEWVESNLSIADGIGAALAHGHQAGPLAEALYSFGLTVFERAEQNMPSTRVAVAAGEFVDLPVKGVQSIASFFGANAGRQEAEKDTENKLRREVGADKQARRKGIARFWKPQEAVQAGKVSPEGTIKAATAQLVEEDKDGNGTRAQSGEVDALPFEKPESCALERAGHDGEGQDRSAKIRPSEVHGSEAWCLVGLPSKKEAGTLSRSSETQEDQEMKEHRGIGRRAAIVQGDEAPEDVPRHSEEGVGLRNDDHLTVGTSSDRPEASCPELSDVDVRQQQRLMADFERQRRITELVKKRGTEGGGKNGRRGSQKRKGRPPESEDGQKRISSFLRQ